MERKVRQCNTCGKTTTDIYSEKGWVTIDSGYSIRFSVTAGRDLTGMARTATYKTEDSPADFCCGSCLLKFLGYRKAGEIS